MYELISKLTFLEIFRLFFSASWNEISNKSNLWERVCVPDLQVESWRDLWDGLVPGEHTLLPGDHDLLLGRQVLEGEDKPPVEVSLPSQRPVVDVCGLDIIRTLQPTGTNFIFVLYCTLYYVLYSVLYFQLKCTNCDVDHVNPITVQTDCIPRKVHPLLSSYSTSNIKWTL